MIKQQQEKIGQLMLWFSQSVPNLYITKLLKLLYLVDETAVRRTGVPVTWLKYLVWQYGPVAPIIYNDLTFNNAAEFGNYVKRKIEQGNWKIGEKELVKILPAGHFDSSVFSMKETEIIEEIITKYGHKSATELVNILHQEDTLWHKIYQENKLEELFACTDYNTSPYEIDLSVLVASDELRRSLYEEMEEFMAFAEAF